MISAGEGIKIAQARDTLRYAKTRSGNYLPRIHRFEVGDYVYLKHRQDVSLDMPVSPTILRVIGFTPTGNLILMGACGSITDQHPEGCVPCHLPDIDPIGDPSLFYAPADLSCQVCHSPADGGKMPLCDFCNRGWHIYCLSPPLPYVPAGAWICPVCVKQGRTMKELGKQERLRLRQAGVTPPVFTPEEVKRLTKLHGSLISKDFPAGKTGTKRFKGIARYQGLHRDKPFFIIYTDKDTEHMSEDEVKMHLCPQGTPVPKSLRKYAEQPLQLVAHTSQSASVLSRPITDAASLHSHLAACLPGAWPPHLIASIFAGLPGQPGYQPAPPVMELDLLALYSCFALSALPSIIPIFDEHSTVATTLEPVCAVDVIPDWSSFHYDSPSSVTALLDRLAGSSSVIGQPPPSVLDLLLPALATSTRPLVSFLVPSSYVTQTLPARAAWFRQMNSEGRLHTLAGLPAHASDVCVVWLSTFCSEAMKQQLLRTFPILHPFPDPFPSPSG